LRWWESKPRYQVELTGSLKFDPSDAPGSRFQEVKITDISEGGVFAILKEKVELGQTVALNFSLHHVKLSPVGKVVHLGRGSQPGCGIQFTEMGIEEHRALKRAIRGLDMLGYECRTPVEPWWQDLYKWASRLVRTGQGLVPDVPKAKPQLRAVEPIQNGHDHKDDASKAA
jgi:hypothetical protein